MVEVVALLASLQTRKRAPSRPHTHLYAYVLLCVYTNHIAIYVYIYICIYILSMYTVNMQNIHQLAISHAQAPNVLGLHLSHKTLQCRVDVRKLVGEAGEQVGMHVPAADLENCHESRFWGTWLACKTWLLQRPPCNK